MPSCSRHPSSFRGRWRRFPWKAKRNSWLQKAHSLLEVAARRAVGTRAIRMSATLRHLREFPNMVCFLESKFYISAGRPGNAIARSALVCYADQVSPNCVNGTPVSQRWCPSSGDFSTRSRFQNLRLAMCSPPRDAPRQWECSFSFSVEERRFLATCRPTGLRTVCGV